MPGWKARDQAVKEQGVEGRRAGEEALGLGILHETVVSWVRR